MVVSYWEMAASFVTEGILHQQLFTQNCRELLFVWERIQDLVPALRKSFKNSNLASNLEIVANTMVDDRVPDSAFGILSRRPRNDYHAHGPRDLASVCER